MKTALFLRTNQQLTLTPTLSQAINLLQLSSYELEDQVSEFAQKNPLLEYTPSPYLHNLGLDKQEDGLEQQIAQPTSLTSFLLQQLNLAHFPENIYERGVELIYNLDDVGWLSSDYWASLSSNEAQLLRNWLHQVEPLGIGSSNLQECLLWQLYYDPELKWHPAQPLLVSILTTKKLFEKDLNGLKDLIPINKRREVEDLFSQLSCRPIDLYYEKYSQEYLFEPELVVVKDKGRFEVYLNEAALPRVSLHPMCQHIEQHKSLKQLGQQAKIFIKSLEARHETLLKVAQTLVAYQQEFFCYGQSGLHPLILEDVAKETGFHESTISRITTQKYIQTPLGVFPLKVLLSRGVRKRSGELASTSSIKQVILDLIAHESKKNPYSDQDITAILSRQGYVLARRTVAKYREQLSIAPSHQRREER